MGMTSKEEEAALKAIEPFISRTAHRYGRGQANIDDLMQEARLGALLALRTWVAKDNVKLATHCMRNAWWRVYAQVLKQKRRKGIFVDNQTTANRDLSVSEDLTTDLTTAIPDVAAIDAERALIILELFNSLTPAQQADIEARMYEAKRGQSSKSHQAREAARRLLEEAI